MSAAYEPRDPAWADKVRASFARQPMMAQSGGGVQATMLAARNG